MNNVFFYMKKAIDLAKKGMFTTSPNPNVGCVIVKKKTIIGLGWHQKLGKPHAETIALNMAGTNSFGATAYVTLEPCCHFGKTPPCCHALVKSGINKIVISTIDPNPIVQGKGIKYLKDHGLIVKIGILEKESKNINLGYFKRMNTGVPWVQLKLGTSIDGRIALKNGNSKWITCEKSRKDVQIFRAKSQVILSTSNTVLLDKPLFTVRLTKNNSCLTNTKNINFIQQPILAIIDNQNKIKPNNYTIQNRKEKIWLIRIKKDNETWPKYVKQIIIPEQKNKIDLKKLLKFFGQNLINTVWVESGSQLSGLLLEKNLIDELILYISPKILGQNSKPLFLLNQPFILNQKPKFKFHHIQQFNSDLRLILRKTILS